MPIKTTEDRAAETGSTFEGSNAAETSANITDRFDNTTHNDNPYDDAIQYLAIKADQIIEQVNVNEVSVGPNGKVQKAELLANTRKIGGVDFHGGADIDLPGVNTDQTDRLIFWSGSAQKANILATSRRIGGVAFNGSANINLPGVDIAGTQDTSGTAATASKVPYTGLTGAVPTWNQATTGNAATATLTTTYKNGNRYFLTPSDFTMHRAVSDFGTAGTFLSFNADQRAYTTFTLPINSKIFKLKSKVTATGGSFTMSANYLTGLSGPAAGVVCTSLVNQEPQIGAAAKYFDASTMYLSIEYNTPPGAAARLFSAYVDWV
tara:strand:+ start:793 stop:1755 length:963 start_codon:yes stop_codon:yes gene_type:complete